MRLLATSPRALTLAVVAAASLLAAPAAAQCASGTASAVIDESDVSATVYNNGQLFYNSTATFSQYVVPKASGNSPMYAAGLWMGGFVGGQLRVAGTNYGNTAGFEYAPGPLDQGTGQPPNPTNCTAYNRIYRISDADVAVYEGGGAATPDLAQWPIGLGAPAVDASGNPIVTTDRTRVINLAAGERPVVPGSEVAFWVMNDYTTHPETSSLPLGVEVQALAFVVSHASPFFNQATFYRFTVVNRGSQPITDYRIGLFTDPDLGDAADDYVGSDVGRSMVYTYNADNQDGTGTGGTYGLNPPAIGLDLLQGAYALMFFVNQAGIPTNDPSTTQEYYNILRGVWKDGTPMTRGLLGYGSGGEVTRFAFEGDPTVPAYWSENRNTATGGTNTPGDRRMVGNVVTGTLASGETGTFDLALIFARGSSNLNSVTVLDQASDAIQAAYDAGTLFPATTNPPVPVAPHPAPAALDLAATPNPATGRAAVTFALPSAAAVRLVAYDVLGREVAVLAEGARAAGTHAVAFETAGLPGGLYLLVLEADGARATARVTVAR